MAEPSLEQLLHAVVGELERLGAEHMLVGGLGLIAWIEPRATTDIDVVIAADTTRAIELGRGLADRLGGVASMRTIRFKDGMCLQRVLLQHAIGEVAVDLILANDAFLQEALSRRYVAELPGIGPTPIATAEDLVVMKLRAWRDKDVVDAVELARLPGLDRGYVERQARGLRVLARWRKVTARADRR